MPIFNDPGVPQINWPTPSPVLGAMPKDNIGTLADTIKSIQEGQQQRKIDQMKLEESRLMLDEKKRQAAQDAAMRAEVAKISGETVPQGESYRPDSMTVNPLSPVGIGFNFEKAPAPPRPLTSEEARTRIQQALLKTGQGGKYLDTIRQIELPMEKADASKTANQLRAQMALAKRPKDLKNLPSETLRALGYSEQFLKDLPTVPEDALEIEERDTVNGPITFYKRGGNWYKASEMTGMQRNVRDPLVMQTEAYRRAEQQRIAQENMKFGNELPPKPAPAKPITDTDIIKRWDKAGVSLTNDNRYVTDDLGRGRQELDPDTAEQRIRAAEGNAMPLKTEPNQPVKLPMNEGGKPLPIERPPLPYESKTQAEGNKAIDKLRGEFKKNSDVMQMAKKVQGNKDILDGFVTSQGYDPETGEAPAGGAFDEALLAAWQRGLDPDTAIREGEIKRTLGFLSTLPAVAAAVDRWTRGEGFGIVLDPSARKTLYAALQYGYGAKAKRIVDAAKRYRDMAQKRGLNPDDLFIDLPTELIDGIMDEMNTSTTPSVAPTTGTASAPISLDEIRKALGK